MILSKNFNKILSKRFFSISKNSLGIDKENLTYFSYINPNYYYIKVDNAIREYIFFISENQKLGLGLGILISSISLKLLLSPLIFKTKVIHENMKKKKPDIDNHTKLISEAYKIGKKNIIYEENKKLKSLKEKFEINKIIPITIFQSFTYITWFFSIKYILNNKILYPMIENQSFLWLNNLYTPDKYALFPIYIVLINYLHLSQNIKNNLPADEESKNLFYNFLKISMFISIPILSQLPSGLLVHWASLSSIHLFLTIFLNSNLMKSYMDKNFNKLNK